MSNKALITRRAGEPPVGSVCLPGGNRAEWSDSGGRNARWRGCSRDRSQSTRRSRAGFRVKLLPDTNLLHIGRYTIDVETDAVPEVPRELDISAAELPGWPHHLVQLAGPPIDTSVKEIEARGIDVVEPVSGYAVFVYATGDAVNALRDLPFVVWTGPLKPAYRIVASAAANSSTCRWASIQAARRTPCARRSRPHTAASSTSHASLQTTAVSTRFFRVQGAAIEVLARVPHVRWVEAVPRKQLDGERESQIVAENLDGAAAPATAPVPGYQSWLAQVDVDGTESRLRSSTAAWTPTPTTRRQWLTWICADGRRRSSITRRRRCHRHQWSRHTRGRHRARKRGDRTDRRPRRRTTFSGDRAWRLVRDMSHRMRCIAACTPAGLRDAGRGFGAERRRR